MTVTNFSWGGAHEFDTAIEALIDRMHTASKVGLAAAGDAVVKETGASFGTATGPTNRTGALLASVIRTEVEPTGFGYTVQVGPSGVVYARRVELGKRKPFSAGSHPYLQPGFGRAAKSFTEIFAVAWAKAAVR